MGEHDASPRGAQRRDRRSESRPCCRDVTRCPAREPAVEGVGRVPGETGRDERAREMHAGRYFVRGQDVLYEWTYGERRFALESLAHLAQALGATRTDVREMLRELRVGWIEVETDHVQGLTVPLAGDLDAAHVSNTPRKTGEARRLAAGDGVVIGECGERDASSCTQVDEGLRREQAIGVMAVQMEIGEGGRAHRRYDSRMSLPSGQSPRWDDIDTVLLDLDGTLLDLAFDNYIWLARVAEIYAENHGLSLAETHAELAPRFKRVQGTLDWYSIDYWTAQLGIDIERVHREEAHRVAWLPGARGFLETVRERGKRLVLMTNSHPVILGIKHERTRVLDYLDAAHTSHGFGAPKEDQRFWIAARTVEPFDPARTMFVDDSKAVLHAAIEAGVRWVYGVKRPDTSRDPHQHEEFAAIDGVVDLL